MTWITGNLFGVDRIRVTSKSVYTFSNVWTQLWFAGNPTVRFSHDDDFIRSRRESVAAFDERDRAYFMNNVRYMLQLELFNRIHGGSADKAHFVIKCDDESTSAISDLHVRDPACEALFYGLFYTVIDQLACSLLRCATATVTIGELYTHFVQQLHALSRTLTDNMAVFPAAFHLENDMAWNAIENMPDNPAQLQRLVDRDDYKDELCDSSSCESDGDDADENHRDDEYNLNKFLRFHKPVSSKRAERYVDFIRTLNIPQDVTLHCSAVFAAPFVKYSHASPSLTWANLRCSSCTCAKDIAKSFLLLPRNIDD